MSDWVCLLNYEDRVFEIHIKTHIWDWINNLIIGACSRLFEVEVKENFVFYN